MSGVRRPAWGVLAAVLAAGATGAAEEAGPVRWDVPAEVLARGGGLPIPVAAARTGSGGVGVFVFEKDAGLVLHLSRDGRAPWKAVFLPEGVAGDACADGDAIECVTTDFAAKTAAFGAWDPARGTTVRRAEIARDLPSTPMFSRLLAEGRDRFVLLVCERGEVFFLKSGDAGATWSAPLQIAQTRHRDDAVAPALFRIGGVLTVFSVDAEDRLRGQSSDDGGGTWTPRDAPDVATKEDGIPRAVGGAGSGPGFTFIVLTDLGRYLPVSGTPAGRTWHAGAALGRTVVDDLAFLFQARSVAGLSAFAWAEPGEARKVPGGIGLHLSRDGGRRWTDTGADAGCARPGGFPALFLDAAGRITVAFTVPPDPAAGGATHVLVRHSLLAGEAGGAPPADAPWWRGGK